MSRGCWCDNSRVRRWIWWCMLLLGAPLTWCLFCISIPSSWEMSSMLEVWRLHDDITSDDFGRFLAFHHQGRCESRTMVDSWVPNTSWKKRVLDAHYFDLSLVISSSCFACISCRSISGTRIAQLKVWPASCSRPWSLFKGVLFTVVLKDESSSRSRVRYICS